MAASQPPKKRAPGGGRKRFQPDEKQRLTVSIMAACGMPHAEIARQIINPDTGLPISEPTLRSAFRADLDSGKARATALVAQSLFKKATGEGKGAVAAAIFWLKTQGRWKEAPQQVELTGKDGGPVEQKTTVVDEQQIKAAVAKLEGEY